MVQSLLICGKLSTLLTINHGIFLHKMKEQFGISNIELKLFESYLSDREQVTFVNGVMSSSKRIVCGVSQGSILGPLLFSTLY